MALKAARREPQRVYMFRRRFRKPIVAGVKDQTLRAPRKRKTKVGDLISIREWTGKPYRSTQRRYAWGRCVYSGSALIHVYPGAGVHVSLDGRVLRPAEVERFARRDGFEGAADFALWYLRDAPDAPGPGVHPRDVVRWKLVPRPAAAVRRK